MAVEFAQPGDSASCPLKDQAIAGRLRHRRMLPHPSASSNWCSTWCSAASSAAADPSSKIGFLPAAARRAEAVEGPPDALRTRPGWRRSSYRRAQPPFLRAFVELASWFSPAPARPEENAKAIYPFRGNSPQGLSGRSCGNRGFAMAGTIAIIAEVRLITHPHVAFRNGTRFRPLTEPEKGKNHVHPG